MSYLGNMIKMHREALGLSQEELGRRLGVGRATINKYERGHVENVPIRNLERLSEVFNTTPARLLGWDEGAHIEGFMARIEAGVKFVYQEDGLRALKLYHELSSAGKEKATAYLSDLSKLYGGERGEG